MTEIEARLNSLERQYRRMQRFVWVAAVFLLVTVAAISVRPSAAKASGDALTVLRAKGLVIIDDDGTERVWIGASLPGKLVNGKREQRPSKQAGIVLYDDKGIERSGYVTDDKSGNVFLSLDDRTRQEAVFLADAARGTTIHLWYDRDSVEIRVDPDDPSGTPRLRLVRAGKTIFEQGSQSTDSQESP